MLCSHLQAMLHLASLFVFHQAGGLPIGSAPYSPTKGKDLKSTAFKIYSMLRTSFKAAAFSPELFASHQLFVSHHLDKDWSLLYSNLWTYGAKGIWDIPGYPGYILPLLEMLPSFACIQVTRDRATDLSWGHHHVVDMGLRVPRLPSSAQIAASVLISITSYLAVHTHRALDSPTLGLDILTSQTTWTILEAAARSLVSAQDALLHRTEMSPQPSASSQEGSLLLAPGGEYEVGAAISLSAFLACLVDWIFCLTTSMPSALVRKEGCFLPNADFVTALEKRVTSALKLLSAVHRGKQADALPPDFLPTLTEALCSISSEPLVESSNGLGDPLVALSALSHVLSNPVWDVLTERLPAGETAAGIVTRLMTFSLYQAVAVTEKWLPSIACFTGADRSVPMDLAMQKQWQHCRASVVRALLMSPPSEAENADTSSCHTSSTKQVPPSQPSSDVIWSAMLPLLRSSLLQLRAVLESFCSSPFVPRDWELIKAELLLGEEEKVWGVSSCCSTACTCLEGPCEVEVKTLACGGMCGARYCCRTCQEQAWRAGHRRNCGALKEMRDLVQRHKDEHVQDFDVRNQT